MRIFNLIFISLFSVSAVASQVANAKMRAMLETDTSKVIKALKAKGKKISAEERKTMELAQFAQEALAMTKIYHYEAREADKIDSNFMRSDIEKAIMNRDWDKPLSAKHKTFVTSRSSELKDLFGEDSFAWAWTLAQSGKQDQAKAILIKRFNSDYENVMKMTHFFRHTGQPLGEVEAIEKAIKNKCTPAQKAEIETKMREMKSHLSTLPDSGIVT